MDTKHAKCCNFHAEIIKFGLILTNLKLLGWAGRRKNVFSMPYCIAKSQFMINQGLPESKEGKKLQPL